MRFALYFTPNPHSLLWELGSSWIGRDALKDMKISLNSHLGISREFHRQVTKTPRRYGFHATLKPPFTLSDNNLLPRLKDSLKNFASSRQQFPTSPLELRNIGNFFCLCPKKQSTQLSELAADTVQHFDHFRAPLSSAEIASRRKRKLTPEQELNLKIWGYPYVLNQFRFHITLSDTLRDLSKRQLIKAALTDHFAPILHKSITIDSITLCVEPQPGRHFVFSKRYSFQTSSSSTPSP